MIQRHIIKGGFLSSILIIVFGMLLQPGYADSNRSRTEQLASIVRSNDLIYKSVPKSEKYGAPVGNGKFGGVLVFTKNELTWQMNHTDFWRFNPETKIHFKYGAHPFGLGRLTFRWPQVSSESNSAVQGCLGLYVAVFTYLPAPQSLRIENIFDMDNDCAIFQVRSEGIEPITLTIELETWRPETELYQSNTTAMVYDPADAARSTHEIAYLTKLTGGKYETLKSTQATGIKIIGENITPLTEDGKKRAFEVKLDPGGKVYVYAATTVLEGTGILPNPVEKTEELLTQQSHISYAEHKENHNRWWQNFWDASYIQIESSDSLAAFVENLWYLNLYTMAISDRGKYPSRFGLGNFFTQEDERIWGGGYWYYNQQYTPMSMLAANHIEFVEHSYSPLSDNLELLKAQSLDLWKHSGAFVHETHSPDGLAYEENRNNIYTDNTSWTSLIFSTGAECAFHMYKYSLYRDDDYQRKVVYPFMREVCLFYTHHLKKDKEGIYHLYPANAHENFWEVKDPQTDLAAVRGCFPVLIKMYDEYGGDERERELFEDILNHLAPFPKGKWLTTTTRNVTDNTWYGTLVTGVDTTIDMFAPAIVVDDNKVHNFHAVDTYSVYPFEVTLPGDAEYQTAVNTFKNRFYHPTSNVLQHDVLPPALLKLPDEFKKCMADYITVNPSRLNDTTPGGEYITAPSMALNLMLLQSQRQIIQLFPACPADWNASFKLRAEGPSIVEASRQNGQVKSCTIQCLKTQDITVANVWDKEVEVLEGTKKVISSSEQLIRWKGIEGKIYYLVEKGAKPIKEFRLKERKPNENARKYEMLVLGSE